MASALTARIPGNVAQLFGHVLPVELVALEQHFLHQVNGLAGLSVRP